MQGGIMEKLFSIGELSKLFNISIKTLRYYDKINLFKPIYINPETSYRYYSTNQFEQLNTINYLKVLGMPLKEIKTHLEKRNINYIKRLMEVQMLKTTNKIEELNKIKMKLENQINFLSKLNNIVLNKIEERTFPERIGIFLKRKIKNNSDMELSIRELENLTNNNNSIFIGKVGVSLKKESIINKKFEYDELFILPEDEKYDDKFIKKFPKGKYVCISFQGSHSEAYKHYELLIAYITQNQFVIMGDSFERTLIDFGLTNNLNEYITEIQIPIK